MSGPAAAPRGFPYRWHRRFIEISPYELERYEIEERQRIRCERAARVRAKVRVIRQQVR